jgi:hypothetical protein
VGKSSSISTQLVIAIGPFLFIEKTPIEQMAPKIRAKQNWSRTRQSLRPDINYLNQVTTWLIPFVITSPNQTTMTFKSGNKSYGLSGATNEVGTGGSTSYGTSEIALKRKYR